MEHPKVVHLPAFDHLKRSSIFQSLSLSATYQIPDGFQIQKNDFNKRLRQTKTRPTSATDVHHIPRWLFKTRFPDVMTRLFVHHDTPYIRSQLRISSAPHHPAIQVMVALRKQTRPYLSIRGQPHAAAVS